MNKIQLHFIVWCIVCYENLKSNFVGNDLVLRASRMNEQSVVICLITSCGLDHVHIQSVRQMTFRHDKRCQIEIYDADFQCCVHFFTTIRRRGNKFGNVSSLRSWVPNEARPGCSRLVLLSSPHAASRTSASHWANKLKTHAQTCNLAICRPFAECCARSSDMTRWKATLETERWALKPWICLSLLYLLSPPLARWPSSSACLPPPAGFLAGPQFSRLLSSLLDGWKTLEVSRGSWRWRGD